MEVEHLKHLNFFFKITISKKRLMTMKDYIPNQANLKTELVLYKTSTAHVEECHGISKFMKIFRFFFICYTNKNITTQTKE